jgi:glucokinase
LGIAVSSYSDYMPTRRIIGVDIGETRLLAGAVDASLAVHHRTRRALSGSQQTILLDAALDAIDETRDAAGADVAALGFAIRSFAAQGSDDAFAPARIAHQMAERVGLPAFADAAANVVALAEQRAGAARGARDAVVVTIDTKVEAGVIVAGELTHPGAAPAFGFDGIADLARMTELAHDGDADATQAVARLGERIGGAIANFVRIYEPQVVVVAGIATVGDLLLGSMRSGLASAGTAASGDEVPIVTAKFGADAGIAGAAALALDRLERNAA